MRVTRKASKGGYRMGIVLLLAAGPLLFGFGPEILNALSAHQQYLGLLDVSNCPLLHTSKIGSSSIVIDKRAVKAQPKDRIDLLKQFTFANYEKHMMQDAGKEHYTLWHYMTSTFHDYDDCRHVVDIGTRYVASSLALGASGVPVRTFDIPTSTERRSAFRGKTEEEWFEQLETVSSANGGPTVQIEFYNVDLLAVSDEEFREHMSTWLIILDTHHLPYTVPFEREFLERLASMEPKFEGILMLDDVHLNAEMKKWWIELGENADRLGYKMHDLTSVGHFSGTGLLDFSGKVSIIE